MLYVRTIKKRIRWISIKRAQVQLFLVFIVYVKIKKKYTVHHKTLPFNQRKSIQVAWPEREILVLYVRPLKEKYYVNKS